MSISYIFLIVLILVLTNVFLYLSIVSFSQKRGLKTPSIIQCRNHLSHVLQEYGRKYKTIFLIWDYPSINPTEFSLSLILSTPFGKTKKELLKLVIAGFAIYGFGGIEIMLDKLLIQEWGMSLRMSSLVFLKKL